ncbi:MAG TPA: SO_0444 family Cu/Zn efflux transporter [Candidatus Krumholzibacteria bacterium]|nr:SO_0444 family Cu/Zn efflux transporter [Candidatus Krumholzibacteria bacterium]
MREFFSVFADILRDSSPFLLLGFALAGLIHVLMKRFPGITAGLSGPGNRPVFLAALVGAPMPLCSCSVLPAALALRRQGASKGATASFLISVPETDIVSIMVTLALIGPVMAVYRPLAAIVAALATGLVIQVMERGTRAQTKVPADTASAAACCEPAADRVASPEPWWVRALRYGFVEMFDDIAPQLILGIAVAAAIGALVPALDPAWVRAHIFLSYVVMMLVGIPMYVCAAASTPVAAGLIAAGVSPGAAMVFLLAGPATNVASMLVLRAELGRRALAVYVVMIAASSIVLGAILDALLGLRHINVAALTHGGGGAPWVGMLAMFAFLLWTGTSFYRTRIWRRARTGLARLLATGSSAR